MLSERLQRKASCFRRDFNKRYHAFGETSTKGIMLSERLKQKVSCFRRDSNKRLHAFGKISTKCFMLSERLQFVKEEIREDQEMGNIWSNIRWSLCTGC